MPALLAAGEAHADIAPPHTYCSRLGARCVYWQDGEEMEGACAPGEHSPLACGPGTPFPSADERSFSRDARTGEIPVEEIAVPGLVAVAGLAVVALMWRRRRLPAGASVEGAES